MRRSTLIAIGYAGFGVLFIVNAATGAGFRSTTEINVERRTITWGVLGVFWLLVCAYALLRPEQFDTGTDESAEWKPKAETRIEPKTETEIGYGVMFSAVFVVLLALSAGVLLNLLLTVI